MLKTYFDTQETQIKIVVVDDIWGNINDCLRVKALNAFLTLQTICNTLFRHTKYINKNMSDLPQTHSLTDLDI